ncbi:MAG: hypothetical protein ABFE13_00495 [Phycisphaerales bacterium]
MVKVDRAQGFTRVDVVVIVLVAALLAAIVPAASQYARSDAVRETCRANLAEIGKAMFVYANDYDGELPRAGGRNSTWGNVVRWNAPSRQGAFGLAVDSSGGKASISSCFYLLVKYAQLQPKVFVCPGDTGTAEFTLSNVRDLPSGFELIDAWDFGPESSSHCSYAYHLPYESSMTISTRSAPQMAVAADRNPWFRTPAAEPGDFATFKPDLPEFGGSRERARRGNSRSHERDGQNVLFIDGRVSFEERSYCGLDRDNIYTSSGDIQGGAPRGQPPTYSSVPSSPKDSYLVHDPATTKGVVTPQAREVDSRTLKQTAVVATLDCPLPEHKNAIWCSTFQMAWDRLKTDVIGEPIRVLKAEELANRLNGSAFPPGDIEAQSYYANAGFVKNGIIEQIQRDMAQRFPSEPAPAFDSRYKTLPEVIMAYAYLNVDVGFEHPYYVNNDPFTFAASDGEKSKVTSFCSYARTSDGNNAAVREQVEILYYDYGDSAETVQFAVDLGRSTHPYQVILARVPSCSTFGDAMRTFQEKAELFRKDPDYEVLHTLRPIDTMVVPDVLYKLTHHFEELLGKCLGNRAWTEHVIFDAMQKIDFTLSRTGVSLKSEARMGAAASRGRPPEQLAKPRHLRFDRPFLICVKKRQPGATPFFLMWVDNAELMQLVARDP